MVINCTSYFCIIFQIMQRVKHRYSLWRRFKICLTNLFSRDINTRIHGVPAQIVDTRYEDLLMSLIIKFKSFTHIHIVYVI